MSAAREGLTERLHKFSFQGKENCKQIWPVLLLNLLIVYGILEMKGVMPMDVARMINRLKNVGIEFEEGMTEKELDSAEKYFLFCFPKEMREFLSCGVPVGSSFFDYRDLSDNNLKHFRDFAASIERSFRFDLENNREEMLELLGEKLGFFQDSASFDSAVVEYLNKSVKLIPFFAHRCFFDGMDDMPIVSFWQPVDTIFYGGTFENYLEHEFLKMDKILDNTQERMENAGIWKDLIW